MKFAPFFLFLLLLSCRSSIYIQSDIITSEKVEVRKRDNRVTWHIYYGDKYTAWLTEDGGKSVVLIIPNGKHGRDFQFKKTVFKVVSYSEQKDNEFSTVITSSEGIDYVIKLHSPPVIGNIFIAWIPR